VTQCKCCRWINSRGIGGHLVLAVLDQKFGLSVGIPGSWWVKDHQTRIQDRSDRSKMSPAERALCLDSSHWFQQRGPFAFHCFALYDDDQAPGGRRGIRRIIIPRNQPRNSHCIRRPANVAQAVKVW